jgi:hypothetical protein
MNFLIKSIEAEFRRYKAMADGALAQVTEAMLVAPGPANGNSLAIICWHISGNLQSRFTDFLTADGEKEWRHREEEFAPRNVSRAELMEKWERGWQVLFDTLATLTNADLEKPVAIRQQPIAVYDALNRALAHQSYHVGQIVYVAHAHRGADWKYLTIPPGQSETYNAAPSSETPAAHAEHLRKMTPPTA